MSVQDKARVKAAITTFLADRTVATVREVRLQAERETGLVFGQTTIARFMADLGWQKMGAEAGTTIYEKSASA